MKVLVTGATGFVGAPLLDTLISRGYDVTGTTRSPTGISGRGARSNWVIHDLTKLNALFRKIGRVDVVYHLAGRAHVLRNSGPDSDNMFHLANAVTTERFALAAADAGVHRFVFVSTIGVHQGELRKGEIVDESSPLTPEEPYAVSKLEAEQRLRRISESSGMEICIVRPVLVVGGGAPGNLARLAALVAKGFPFPIPTKEGIRSFVSLSNLVDLLILCGERSAAAGQEFVAADEPWISTRQVVEWIGEGIGKKVRLVTVNPRILELAFAAARRGHVFHKLFDCQRVDATKARRILGWESRNTLREAFLSLGQQYGQNL